MKVFMTEIENEYLGKLRGLHHTPFSWQEKKTMKLIRANFLGKKCSSAIAVYCALTECASDEGRKARRHTAIFTVTLHIIAKKAGKSVSTVKRYTSDFRKLGLLEWKTSKKGKVNKPNLWMLFKCPDQDTGRTPMRNSELRDEGHNSEPDLKERERKFFNNKKPLNNEDRKARMQSIREVIDKSPKGRYNNR